MPATEGLCGRDAAQHVLAAGNCPAALPVAAALGQLWAEAAVHNGAAAERLEFLLSMKERTNGYKFKSCDCKMMRLQFWWSVCRLRVNAKYRSARSKLASTWPGSYLR